MGLLKNICKSYVSSRYLVQWLKVVKKGNFIFLTEYSKLLFVRLQRTMEFILLRLHEVIIIFVEIPKLIELLNVLMLKLKFLRHWKILDFCVQNLVNNLFFILWLDFDITKVFVIENSFLEHIFHAKILLSLELRLNLDANSTGQDLH